MTSSFSRVCVVGCGAIGGWLGAGLAKAGCQVSVVARGATLAALQRQGLRMGDAQHTVTASADATDLGVQDLVIVAVKAPALREVTRQMGALIGPHTVVLTAMNGVPWWFFQGFGGALAGTQLHAVDATGEIAAAIAASSVSVVWCMPAVRLMHPVSFATILAMASSSVSPLDRSVRVQSRWRRCSTALASTPACHRKCKKTSGTSCGAT